MNENDGSRTLKLEAVALGFLSEKGGFSVFLYLKNRVSEKAGFLNNNVKASKELCSDHKVTLRSIKT